MHISWRALNLYTPHLEYLTLTIIYLDKFSFLFSRRFLYSDSESLTRDLKFTYGYKRDSERFSSLISLPPIRLFQIYPPKFLYIFPSLVKGGKSIWILCTSLGDVYGTSTPLSLPLQRVCKRKKGDAEEKSQSQSPQFNFLPQRNIPGKCMCKLCQNPCRYSQFSLGAGRGKISAKRKTLYNFSWAFYTHTKLGLGIKDKMMECIFLLALSHVNFL